MTITCECCGKRFERLRRSWLDVAEGVRLTSGEMVTRGYLRAGRPTPWVDCGGGEYQRVVVTRGVVTIETRTGMSYKIRADTTGHGWTIA